MQKLGDIVEPLAWKLGGLTQDEIDIIQARRLSQEPLEIKKSFTAHELLTADGYISLTPQDLRTFAKYINEILIPTERQKYPCLKNSNVYFQFWEIKKLIWGWRKEARPNPKEIATSMIKFNGGKINFLLCVAKACRSAIWKLSTAKIELYSYTRGVLKRMPEWAVKNGY